MRLPWQRRKRDDSDVSAQAPAGLVAARAERELSEERLAEARREVIRPLREMRQQNHVAEMLGSLIERRAQQKGAHGDAGSSSA